MIRLRGRRRLVRLVLLCLLAGVAGAGAAELYLASRRSLPPAPTVVARSALQRGWNRLGERAPEAAARIAPAVEGALAGRGDLAPALAEVTAALKAEARRLDLAAKRWRALEPVLTAGVATAAERAAEPGLERREASWVERARHLLATASTLAAAGRVDQALELGRRIEELTGAVDTSHRRLFARFADPAELRAWKAWAKAAVEDSRRSDRPVIVVDKLARTLHLLRRGHPMARFDVELGSRGLERKLHQGDRATPEGRYRVTDVKTGARTRYYKALLLGFPNAEDLSRLQRARARGQVPRRVDAGGLIEIHGDGGQGKDWTDGCIALTNPDMDRLLSHVSVGTSVTIVGTLEGSESRF